MPYHVVALVLALSCVVHAVALAQTNTNSTSYSPTPTATLGQVEGMVVYGKRPRPGAIIKLHDEALSLETSRVLFVKEALEAAQVNPVQTDIGFAPRSAALNALGRERLDLIATAMRILDDKVSFTLIPSDNPAGQIRSISKLELARIKTILFYIKTQQQIANPIALPAKLEDKVRARTPWTDDSVDSLTITFTR